MDSDFLLAGFRSLSETALVALKIVCALSFVHLAHLDSINHSASDAHSCTARFPPLGGDGGSRISAQHLPVRVSGPPAHSRGCSPLRQDGPLQRAVMTSVTTDGALLESPSMLCGGSWNTRHTACRIPPQAGACRVPHHQHGTWRASDGRKEHGEHLHSRVRGESEGHACGWPLSRFRGQTCLPVPQTDRDKDL